MTPTVWTPTAVALTVQYVLAPFVAANTWVAGPSLPGPTAFGSAVILSNGDIYYIGGNTATVIAGHPGASNQCLMMNAANMGAWTAKATMPTNRWGHTAVIVKP